MTLDGVAVLAFAIDVIFARDDLTGIPHVALLERTPQAVADHRVDDLPVSHAETFARPLEQVRAVAHRLHAARDHDLGIANFDGLVRQHDGFEPRSADLV